MTTSTGLSRTHPERPCRLDLPGNPNVGWRSAVACAVAGISYRQCDYWTRTGHVVPTVRPARDSGSSRLYSAGDVVLLRLTKNLLDIGVSLASTREYMREWFGRKTILTMPLTVDVDDITITVDIAALVEQVRADLAGRPCEPALMWAAS